MSSRNCCRLPLAPRPPDNSDHAGPSGSSPAKARMPEVSMSSISMSAPVFISRANSWTSSSNCV
eukprot:10261012-Alexandrium_andersonii.AAC.1